MKRFARRAALLLFLGLLIAVIGVGCTLTGATEAPPVTLVATVGGSGVTAQATLPPPSITPTKPLVIGTPTPAKTVDAFGTLTAAAVSSGGTPFVGVVTPTKAGNITPTAVVAKTGTPGAATAGTANCPASYTVVAGDNLFRIALKFNVTVAALAAANGITNPEFILVGTVLKIPGCGSSAAPKVTATATAKAAPTAGAIQPRTGDTVDKNGDILHTVVSGENLYRIALSYGLTWQVVATYNGITNPNAIVVGQVIRIPTK